MIEFNTKVNELLPYNRKEYIALNKWHGVSFQLPGVFEGKDIGLDAYLKAYEDCLKVSSTNWITNLNGL